MRRELKRSGGRKRLCGHEMGQLEPKTYVLTPFEMFDMICELVVSESADSKDVILATMVDVFHTKTRAQLCLSCINFSFCP